MKKVGTATGNAGQEYFSTETDHRTGSGRLQLVVLRAG